MPRSNSRAVVRSSARSGSSRCPMPGGSTQARISVSLSQADTLLPRFMLTAVWIGFKISMSTNTSPVTASGPATGRACWTALTVAPMVTAKTAGSAPLRITSTHQIVASTGSALGSTAKNCHSCLARSRLSTDTTLPLGCDIPRSGTSL